MGSSHTKGSQDIPKIIWRVTGFPSLCFVFVLFCCMCFSPFVRPHATNKILSTGKKKKGTEQWRWGTGARKSAGQEGKVVKPQDYIQEQPSRITKRNER